MVKNIEAILGYDIATMSKDACVAKICSWIESGEMEMMRYVVCANPHSLEVARMDVLFDLAMKGADMIIPDGAGVVAASRLLGGSIRQRVTGYDIFLGVNKGLDSMGGQRVFFLGSTEANLNDIRKRMMSDFPNVAVAGFYSPPFSAEFEKEENDAMVGAVNAVRPDVLWVGLSAPKQEKWIHANRDRLDVKFAGAIGAVFDFYTGRIKRSHPFFQRIGLEWLPRFIREPRRLWRRNLVSSPKFLLRIIRERHNLKA